jgi:hypothetical protein
MYLTTETAPFVLGLTVLLAAVIGLASYFGARKAAR